MSLLGRQRHAPVHHHYAPDDLHATLITSTLCTTGTPSAWTSPPAWRPRRWGAKLNISPSEAVRRALLHYRNEVLGVPADDRRRRTTALDRLFVLFDGHDAAKEIRDLKEQDPHW